MSERDHHARLQHARSTQPGSCKAEGLRLVEATAGGTTEHMQSTPVTARWQWRFDAPSGPCLSASSALLHLFTSEAQPHHPHHRLRYCVAVHRLRTSQPPGAPRHTHNCCMHSAQQHTPCMPTAEQQELSSTSSQLVRCCQQMLCWQGLQAPGFNSPLPSMGLLFNAAPAAVGC
jgi:hypothetical protein